VPIRQSRVAGACRACCLRAEQAPPEQRKPGNKWLFLGVFTCNGRYENVSLSGASRMH
jgi:hypothetical protein